jgi:hypothetical protein
MTAPQTEPLQPGVSACALCGATLEPGDSTLTWHLPNSYVHRKCALDEFELEQAS